MLESHGFVNFVIFDSFANTGSKNREFDILGQIVLFLHL
jgi:hypothetical protein